MRSIFPSLLLVALVATTVVFAYPSSGNVGGECPHLAATRRSSSSIVPGTVSFTRTEAQAYMDAVSALDWDAVKTDIKAVLTTSQVCPLLPTFFFLMSVVQANSFNII
jgi:hypothetical protein